MTSDCPVSITTRQISDLTGQLAGNLVRLSADLELCDTCPHDETCHVVQRFKTAFQIALAEVTSEWNLRNQQTWTPKRPPSSPSN